MFSSQNTHHQIAEGWALFVFTKLYAEKYICIVYIMSVCFGISLIFVFWCRTLISIKRRYKKDRVDTFLKLRRTLSVAHEKQPWIGINWYKYKTPHTRFASLPSDVWWGSHLKKHFKSDICMLQNRIGEVMRLNVTTNKNCTLTIS